MTGPIATTDQRRKIIQIISRVSPRALRLGPFPALLALALLASACTGVSNPEGWAGPTLADDTLYASVEPGKIAALNPADLSARWVFPPDTDEGKRLDLEGIYGAPVVADGVVYFGAYDGNVYALDAVAGTALWRFETNDPIIAAPAIQDDTLYIGSTDGFLYAIDTTACTNVCPPGAVKPFDAGKAIWSSPLIVGDVIYVATMNGRLHALELATLAPVSGFSFKTAAGLTMNPTLAGDDTLLVGGQRWNKPFKGGNWFWGTPLIDGDTIYIADLDGNVHAVGLEDGAPKWASPFNTEAAVRAAPVLAADVLVVVDRHGNAYGLAPEDGSLQWGPTDLGKTVFADPFLLATGGSAGSNGNGGFSGASPSATEEAASATPSPSPTLEATVDEGLELIIVAQGGDICRIDPADGSPAGAVLCAEVPL